MARKARARMLAPSISVSPRVNGLSLKSTLIYTWLIAHADDQGRMAGDAATIKGIVCPLQREISVDDVGCALSEMEERGLVKVYSPEDMTWSPVSSLIQICDWWDYQALHDPQPSKYPPPRGWQDRVGAQQRSDHGRFGRKTSD